MSSRMGFPVVGTLVLGVAVAALIGNCKEGTSKPSPIETTVAIPPGTEPLTPFSPPVGHPTPTPTPSPKHKPTPAPSATPTPTPTPTPSPSATPTPIPSPLTIKIVGVSGSNSYSPNPANLKIGQKVFWQNVDYATAPGHTATGGGFDTGLLTPGVTSSPAITFSAAGTFAYSCKIHSSMTGTITVTP
jgi:plastocyanin